jgi:hypothetical protein
MEGWGEKSDETSPLEAGKLAYLIVLRSLIGMGEPWFFVS